MPYIYIYAVCMPFAVCRMPYTTYTIPQVGSMRAMGVIADIIVFHPYDQGHWGFDCMGGRDAARYDTASDKVYLRYAAARLAAYSNVWWCFLRLGLGLAMLLVASAGGCATCS